MHIADNQNQYIEGTSLREATRSSAGGPEVEPGMDPVMFQHEAYVSDSYDLSDDVWGAKYSASTGSP